MEAPCGSTSEITISEGTTTSARRQHVPISALHGSNHSRTHQAVYSSGIVGGGYNHIFSFFLGSVALLVSNITGPSLVVIPLLYQQAGWLTPVLTFAVIALLSGTAALFLVEAMSSIEGNEGFRASIEFTTIAHLFLGKRWHIVVQGLLYLAMQSLVIASLLEAFQSMDEFLIRIAHKTCAVSFSDGWVCINQISPDAHSAFSGYILGSFGTLMTLSMILPLSLIRLADNIIFQVASFILLLHITILWIVIFAVKGLDVNSVPVVGQDHSAVVGFVLSNFSFVMTTPTWVNETHPSVNIRLAVWVSILISCLIYIPIGWMGGSAFIIPDSSTLLHVLVTSTGHGALSTVAQVSTYMFPLAVLVSSVPVLTIVIRSNLLRGNICSYQMAIFWSIIVPWVIVIPLQTNGALTTILNWGSLIFTSPSNLLIPFVMFIASKRRMASVLSDVDISGDPEMSSTPTEQTMTHVENNTPAVIRIVADSAAGCHASTEKVEKEASKGSGEVAKSTMDVIPMPITNRISSLSGNGYQEQEVQGEAGGFSNGAEMYLMSIGPTMLLEQTMPPVRNMSAVTHVNTDSTALEHDSTEKVEMDVPEGSRELAKSPLDATSMSVANRTYSQSTNADYQQALQSGGGSESLAGISPIDPPILYLAFPILSPTCRIRSTHISAVGFLLAFGLVLTAIIYNIVQNASGD